MLPPPTLSFTIPSIHDNLVLQCRIYHPTCLAPTTISGISRWRKRAAIVAHPYPPLGGNFDDPVVDLVASTILKEGFIVGTFNFRGAGPSKSRTSWQSKPEQNDYTSFIAFMIYYMHHLSSPEEPRYTLISPRFTRSDPELHDLSPIKSQAVPPPEAFNPHYLTPTASNPNSKDEKHQKPNLAPRLLLAGYSYGALITSYLPPIIHSIISSFQTPTPGSAYAEIRLRAQSLALQQNQLTKSRVHFLLSQSPRGGNLHSEDHILHSPKRREGAGNVRVGGEEDLRRVSHDSFRARGSFTIENAPERVRKSVDRIKSMGKNHKYTQRRTGSIGSNSSTDQKKESCLEKSDNVPMNDQVEERNVIKAIPEVGEGLRVAYLLISPLQGWVNTLATMWSMASFRNKDALTEHEMKLTVDPTLAVFGDDDLFVSAKKLRSWAEKLRGKGGGHQFRYREVPGAGHFWQDQKAINTLVEEVDEFVGAL